MAPGAKHCLCAGTSETLIGVAPLGLAWAANAVPDIAKARSDPTVKVRINLLLSLVVGFI